MITSASANRFCNFYGDQFCITGSAPANIIFRDFFIAALRFIFNGERSLLRKSPEHYGATVLLLVSSINIALPLALIVSYES